MIAVVFGERRLLRLARDAFECRAGVCDQVMRRAHGAEIARRFVPLFGSVAQFFCFWIEVAFQLFRELRPRPAGVMALAAQLPGPFGGVFWAADHKS
jgi:hypothetical protein